MARRRSEIPPPHPWRLHLVQTRNAALKEHADNLGQLLLAWSALEMDITLLLNELALIKDRVVKNVLAGMPPIRDKLLAVLAIGYDRRPDDAWYERLQVLVGEIEGKLHEERNRMVHDFWFQLPMPAGAEDVRRTHLRPQISTKEDKVTVKLTRSKPMSAKDIAEVTARIHIASAEAEELMDILKKGDLPGGPPRTGTPRAGS